MSEHKGTGAVDWSAHVVLNQLEHVLPGCCDKKQIVIEIECACVRVCLRACMCVLYNQC